MSRRSARKLTDEDRILWAKVAATATPLAGKSLPLLSEPEMFPPPPGPQAPVSAPHVVSPDTGRQHSFDQPTRRKLAKGRLAVDAKIDLHGMTQGEAHGFLLGFLHSAHGRGLRYVLIVTGKGASFGSDGILKRAVPSWLATPSFRVLVAGFDEAARNHGGGGALYVRLRRSPGDRS
ncbi:MAG: Smr/MutS family protein [Phyllobacteriaceae bacterium]|nr:Smr/MutS family protein [Phyllobacteriaceae bacterium]